MTSFHPKSPASTLKIPTVMQIIIEKALLSKSALIGLKGTEIPPYKAKKLKFFLGDYTPDPLVLYPYFTGCLYSSLWLLASPV